VLICGTRFKSCGLLNPTLWQTINEGQSDGDGKIEMSDYNDFFDDAIDVDDETDAEAPQYFDDDDDDDGDDDSTTVRTAVLTKNGMIALLSLRAGESGGRIVRFDPREENAAHQFYDSEREALKWFRRSLATSRRNGWEVVYDGAPIAG
jgi:hypothetical protein